MVAGIPCVELGNWSENVTACCIRGIDKKALLFAVTFS